MNAELNQWINSLLGGDMSFALYFLPDESEIDFVAGNLEAFDYDKIDNLPTNGFVFAPYKGSDKQLYFLIKEDYYAHGIDAVLKLRSQINTTVSLSVSQQESPTEDVSKEQFETIVKKAVEIIKSDNVLLKVVLSRSKTVTLPDDFDAVAMLYRMKKRMPRAFCYMIYTPQQGLWMGATPERLLLIEKGKAQTYALAGTLPANSDDAWTEKEKDEQQIVTDYIAERLTSIGVTDYEVDGQKEVVSGSVRHLRSVFNFSLSENNVFTVIKILHPTPAICGMPQQLANEFIAENENYSRDYYSGFLGSLGVNGQTSVFVNLRCMKVKDEKAVLYVGAGITEGSIPEKEWQETETKALTLLKPLYEVS